MRFEQLKYILDIAQTESITLTAERFFVTRQAVSGSIKQLEEELGRPLLIRTNMRVYLNHAGEEVARYAQEVLVGKEKLSDTLAQLDGDEENNKQHLKIFSASAVASAVIPKIIHVLNKNGHNALISVMMTDARGLVQGIQGQKGCLGLLSASETELEKRMAQLGQEDYRYDVLARDEMVVCMNKKNFHGDRDYVTMQEISGPHCKKSLYSITPAQAYAELIDENLLACSNDTDFHQKMLKYDNCMVLMPSLAFQYTFDSKRFIALSIKDLDMTLLHVAIYPKAATSGMVKFVELLKKYLYMA